MRRLRLLAITPAGTATFSLPPDGAVVVGRGGGCDVRIDDPALLDEHALLRVGEVLTITDLGSSAGTRVGQQLVTPNATIAVSLGTPMLLGSTMMVVQSGHVTSRLRHVRSHGYFEERLEEECARAAASGGSFAVVRLRGARRAIATLEDTLMECARAMDVVATYTLDEYEVLLVDARAADAASFVDRVAGAVAVGIACYPQDGRTPEALVAVSGEKLRVAAGEALDLPMSDDDGLVLGGAIDRLRDVIERVAASSISVLVQGETGVGKDVVARLIHRLSPRAEKPFQAINCAAMTDTLLESELFGYERGAFTGAVQAKPGLVENADGGTLFLDEAGEMSSRVQAKLLRVLEDREVLRLGSVRPRKIDVRFVTATNRDLEEEVAAGNFRSDLFFRLNGIALAVPPLRERVNEIEALANIFIARAARQMQRRDALRLTPRALDMLKAYDWPGNVRELRNIMERAVVLASGSLIDTKHLPTDKMTRHSTFSTPVTLPPPQSPQSTPPPSQVTGPRPSAREDVAPVSNAAPASHRNDRAFDERADRARIMRALEQCGGNQSEAARMLGIARRTLINRIEQYGLPRPRRRG